MPKPKMTIEVVSVTPAMAKEFLSRNTNNRTINDANVDRLRREIEEGNWRVTHQGIAIDSEGVLLDGQHRLWAIVAAKTAVRMVVARNVDPKSLVAIDQGYRRTPGQTLGLLGVQYGKTWSAIINGIVGALRNHTIALSVADLQMWLSELEPSVGWFEASKHLHDRWTSATPIAAAIILCYPLDPERVTSFVESYKSGVGLTARSPILAARKLTIEAKRALSPAERIVLIRRLCRCIIAWIDEEELSASHVYDLPSSIERLLKAWPKGAHPNVHAEIRKYLSYAERKEEREAAARAGTARERQNATETPEIPPSEKNPT